MAIAGAATAVLVTLIIVLIVMLISNRSDKLKGLWKLDVITSYEFDGKGEGRLIVSGDFVFTYTIDGDKVSIDFKNSAARDITYTFKVEGDTLTLTEEYGKEFVLTRQ